MWMKRARSIEFGDLPEMSEIMVGPFIEHFGERDVSLRMHSRASADNRGVFSSSEMAGRVSLAEAGCIRHLGGRSSSYSQNASREPRKKWRIMFSVELRGPAHGKSRCVDG